MDSRFRGNDGGKFLVLLGSRFSEHGVHGMCLGLVLFFKLRCRIDMTRNAARDVVNDASRSS